MQVAGTKVSILSDVSEAADEIDIERAREARLSAQDLISSDKDNEEVLASLERSEVRLRVAGSEV